MVITDHGDVVWCYLPFFLSIWLLYEVLCKITSVTSPGLFVFVFVFQQHIIQHTFSGNNSVKITFLFALGESFFPWQWSKQTHVAGPVNTGSRSKSFEPTCMCMLCSVRLIKCPFLSKVCSLSESTICYGDDRWLAVIAYNVFCLRSREFGENRSARWSLQAIGRDSLLRWACVRKKRASYRAEIA